MKPIYVRVPMEGNRFGDWLGSQPRGATEEQIEAGWAKYNAGLLARLLHDHTLTTAWEVSTPKETP